MKAVRLFEHGGPEVLKYIDVDMPQAGDNEVLIKVRATTVNMFDLRFRAGKLPEPIPGRSGFPLPFQLGRDAAGDVVAIGAKVTRWKVGDRVLQMPTHMCGRCAMCARGKSNLCINTVSPGHQLFGGYADYIVRKEDAILRIPNHVDYKVAAATMWSYTTPLGCAMKRAPVRPGDTLLITGASSSIATASVQLAKLFGAKVIGSTTKLGRADDLRAIGYDHVVDFTDPNTPALVKQLTNGFGADAVWDTVGNTESLRFSMRSACLGANIAYFGLPVNEQGFDVAVSGVGLIFGEVSIVGVRGCDMRTQELVVELLAEGRISPVIDRSFPLSQAAEAHRYLESGRHIGKVLLLPEHEDA